MAEKVIKQNFCIAYVIFIRRFISKTVKECNAQRMLWKLIRELIKEFIV